MSSSTAAIISQLGASGRRTTPPRRQVIAAALRQREPFTAQQLVRVLAPRGVGRATVFRTLDLLVSLGALSCIHPIESGERCILSLHSARSCRPSPAFHACG